MRLFIGIEFDEQMKNQLFAIRNTIQANSKKGSFTHIDNFHLTLKFLGEVDESKIESIKYSMNSVLTNYHSFQLETGEINYFSRGTKKIVWLGLKGAIKNLENLYKDFEISLEKLNFQKEKRDLKPHITFGREVLLNQNIIFLQKEIDSHFEFTVNTISLFHSTRVNGRLTYIPIARYVLRNSNIVT